MAREIMARRIRPPPNLLVEPNQARNAHRMPSSMLDVLLDATFLPVVNHFDGQFDARKIKCRKPVEKCVMRFFGGASKFIHLVPRPANTRWPLLVELSMLDSIYMSARAAMLLWQPESMINAKCAIEMDRWPVADKKPSRRTRTLMMCLNDEERIECVGQLDGWEFYLTNRSRGLGANCNLCFTIWLLLGARRA